MPRIMIAGMSSGSGKTMITCGILYALKNRMQNIASFKCGPDYIDPMFHTEVIGTKSRNLDTFFTDRNMTKYLFKKAAKGMDMSVIEGVMGYYDGIGGISSKGSSFELASYTDTPVILVVDCKGISYSLLAILKGFLSFQKESHIKGVILNRISKHLYNDLKPVIEEELAIKVYGYVPSLNDAAFGSRHLGLITPAEITNLREKVAGIADTIMETVDLDSLIQLADHAADVDVDAIPEGITYSGTGESKPIIAVAKDPACCFYYEDNFELLRNMGAEIVTFRPTEDPVLPEGIHGLILGGGYPELHAKALSQNVSMRQSIREAIQGGIPCIAECGGYLYLSESLEDADGVRWPMVGVIQSNGYKRDKLTRFGYITLTAEQDNLLCKAGEMIKGHEFHYWDSTHNGEGFHAEKPTKNRDWHCVHSSETMYAGFPHLYFYSNPSFAWNFLDACRRYAYDIK